MFVKERKPGTSQEACKLADDYLAARKAHQGASEACDGRKPRESAQNLRCQRCKKLGHIARDCHVKLEELEGEPGKKQPEKKTGFKCDLQDVECYNCHHRGHYSSNCPKNAREKRPALAPLEMRRAGVVEGRSVGDILLDTGCSHTLVRQELEKLLEGESVAIRCAHGDTVLYPLAQVEVTVGGQTVEVKAAVSKTLPVDVLLGTDIPELGKLLVVGTEQAEALAVITHSQRKRKEAEKLVLSQKDQGLGATVSVISEQSIPVLEWMQALDEGLVEGGRERVRLTRSQKRKARRQLWVSEVEEPLPDQPEEASPHHPLDVPANQMLTLQETDTTLDSARETAEKRPSLSGVGFFKKENGLQYRRWTPPGRHQEFRAVELLVLALLLLLVLALALPLGHVVGSGVVKPVEFETAAVRAFPAPAMKKDVRTVLKMVSYQSFSPVEYRNAAVRIYCHPPARQGANADAMSRAA